MSTLTNIQILRSAVPYKRPDPAFMLDGQLGINYKAEEPGLFTKLQDGGLVKFGPVQITTTGEAPNANPDEDGFPGNSVGEEWLDSRASFYRPIEHIYDGTNWLVTNGFDIDYDTGDFTLLRNLTLTSLEVDYVHIDGNLEVNGSITPDGTTCFHDLGSLSERWKGLFACMGDISGDLAIGGGLSISQNLDIGGNLSVDGDLDVSGSATFGMLCGDGSKFTVKSPAYLDCLVEILGHTQATDLTMSGDLVVEGDVTIGVGCVNTLNVKSKTIFECDVEFITNPITFENIVITGTSLLQGPTTLGTTCSDAITVKGSTTFENCVTTLEGETRVGLTTNSAFRTFGPNVFNEDITGNKNLNIVTGKGYSLPTGAGDPNNTLTTKQYVIDLVANKPIEWEVSGAVIKTVMPNLSPVPDSGTGQIGIETDRWSAVWANVVHTNDLHMKNDRGDWTLIEEADCLTMTNNNTGKRYEIMMKPYAG